MATPRKHWCRLYDSILRESWDAQTGWTVMRLMAWLNQRWARDGIPHAQAGRAVLGPLDIMLITTKRRLDVALKSFERLRDVIGITIERRGDNLAIDWPKFLELQELGPRSPGSDRKVTAPSETSPVSETSPEEKNPQTPVASAPAQLPLEPVEDRVRPIRVDPSKAQARIAWPKCQESAARHGRRWDKLTESRLAAMSARLREHGPDPSVLVRAIDGAVAYWRASAPKDADPTKHLTPETIYRASNFAKYIETATDPKAQRARDWDSMTREEQLELSRRYYAR